MLLHLFILIPQTVKRSKAIVVKEEKPWKRKRKKRKEKIKKKKTVEKKKGGWYYFAIGRSGRLPYILRIPHSDHVLWLRCFLCFLRVLFCLRLACVFLSWAVLSNDGLSDARAFCWETNVGNHFSAMIPSEMMVYDGLFFFFWIAFIYYPFQPIRFPRSVSRVPVWIRFCSSSLVVYFWIVLLLLPIYLLLMILFLISREILNEIVRSHPFWSAADVTLVHHRNEHFEAILNRSKD